MNMLLHLRLEINGANRHSDHKQYNRGLMSSTPVDAIREKKANG
jgi:hypothetical protein